MPENRSPNSNSRSSKSSRSKSKSSRSKTVQSQARAHQNIEARANANTKSKAAKQATQKEYRSHRNIEAKANVTSSSNTKSPGESDNQNFGSSPSDNYREPRPQQRPDQRRQQAEAASQNRAAQKQAQLIDKELRDPNRTGDVTHLTAQQMAAREAAAKVETERFSRARANAAQSRAMNGRDRNAYRPRTDLPGNEVASLGNAGVGVALRNAELMNARPTGNPVADALRGVPVTWAGAPKTVLVSGNPYNPLNDQKFDTKRPPTDIAPWLNHGNAHRRTVVAAPPTDVSNIPVPADRPNDISSSHQFTPATSSLSPHWDRVPTTKFDRTPNVTARREAASRFNRQNETRSINFVGSHNSPKWNSIPVTQFNNNHNISQRKKSASQFSAPNEQKQFEENRKQALLQAINNRSNRMVYNNSMIKATAGGGAILATKEGKDIPLPNVFFSLIRKSPWTTTKAQVRVNQDKEVRTRITLNPFGNAPEFIKWSKKFTPLGWVTPNQTRLTFNHGKIDPKNVPNIMPDEYDMDIGYSASTEISRKNRKQKPRGNSNKQSKNASGFIGVRYGKNGWQGVASGSVTAGKNGQGGYVDGNVALQNQDKYLVQSPIGGRGDRYRIDPRRFY